MSRVLLSILGIAAHSVLAGIGAWTVVTGKPGTESTKSWEEDAFGYVSLIEFVSDLPL